jgi:hypothetical protein
MPESSLAFVLAAVAIVLGLIALLIFYVAVVKDGGVGGRKAGNDDGVGPSDGVAANTRAAGGRARLDAVAATSSRKRRQQAKKGIDKNQRYLFVTFDAPGPESNQALGRLLKDAKALYEADLGIYHVPPGPEGYPLTIANASSPGTLPPLHQDGEHSPVQGISILIKFINSRKVSRSPERLIRFAHNVAAIGGQILDFERNPVTDETFAALRRDTEDNEGSA